MILYFLLLSIKLHLFTRKEKAYWIGGLLHRFSSSDYAELTEHSGSTDYARILNGWSTCSVYEMTQIFQVKGGWRVVKGEECFWKWLVIFFKKKTGICLELSVIFRTFAADVPREQLSITRSNEVKGRKWWKQNISLILSHTCSYYAAWILRRRMHSPTLRCLIRCAA